MSQRMEHSDSVAPQHQRHPAGIADLRVLRPAASEEETAAIAAAIQHFTRDTASPEALASEGQDPWLRAALQEGVARAPGQAAGHTARWP